MWGRITYQALPLKCIFKMQTLKPQHTVTVDCHVDVMVTIPNDLHCVRVKINANNSYQITWIMGQSFIVWFND